MPTLARSAVHQSADRLMLPNMPNYTGSTIMTSSKVNDHFHHLIGPIVRVFTARQSR